MPRHLRLAVLALLLSLGATSAVRAEPFLLERMNRKLAGQLVDHTSNHLHDRRIWSPTLDQRRDLYVYLPPNFDRNCRYPVILWLHGIGQDERDFPVNGLRQVDAAMACGRLPPTIIAIPDGTRNGHTWFGPSTFFLNSNLGPFENYLMQDVWGFLQANYPLRPERNAHVVAGFSGGGAAAYRLAIRYKSEFGIACAVSSPLNVRYVDCQGRYFSNFDPCCWGWRTDLPRHEVIGRFYGVVAIRMGMLVNPLYGRGPEALGALASENPIEMLEAYNMQSGETAMFAGYGGRDQFNLGAQTESFLYRARQRGLDPATAIDPNGKHNSRTLGHLLPDVINWLAPQLAPYAPGAAAPVVAPAAEAPAEMP